MALHLPELRRTGAGPLVEQLVRHFETAIQHGRYRPGDHLPTIRAAASELDVTRATVQEAYRRLARTGLVEATVGRGTVVTAAGAADAASVFSATAHGAWQHLREAPAMPALPPGQKPVANFSLLLPDQDLFPVDAFREALGRVMRENGASLLLYGHPLGHLALREQLAAHPDAGEIACTADEILVTSGAQQGIDLVLRTFAAPGDAVAVAVPTYHQLFGLLRAHGLDIVPLPHGHDGVDLVELARVLSARNVRLLYVMPSFHNPTGRTLTQEQRQDLMRVVARTRVPVLEDEFQRELRFQGGALPTLRELDPRGLTITVRTFSKGLFPGIRTGWVRAAADVLSRMAALKRFSDLESSSLLQAALADFMQRGELERHLETLRAELRERHAVAQRALARHLPAGSTWTRADGGFALWVEVPSVDGERLALAAAARGVLVVPGRVFVPEGMACNGVRLSLSRAGAHQIEAGIAALGACAHQLFDQSSSSRHRIFL